jgi:mannose-6-phosphate isomerase-like protein (cupin superfamily)
MVQKLRIQDAIEEIDGRPYHPVELARVNAQLVRLAFFKGDYHWHKHQNEEELFLVHTGEIVLQVEGQEDLVLGEGELAVVPTGVSHRPRSDEGAYVLMFEPARLVSTGD